MRQLLRAVIFGILGYLVGATLTWLVRGGSLGDEVCVVEAMKMEQSIRSNRDGVVKTVLVKPMDSVKANDPLVELE